MAGLVKREHLVAAGLVGTVVVVVGFASGLGIRQQPAAGATEAAPPATAPPSGNEASPPAAGSAAGGSSGSSGGSGYYSTGGAGGIDYVGTPIGGGATTTSPPATDPPSTQPPTTTPTSPPTTTPPTTGNPVPGCQEGLVPAVLDKVTNAVVAVPVAGPALGTLGITNLGSGLLGGLGLLAPGSGSSTTDNPLAGILDPLVVTCVAQAEIPASAPTVVLGAGS